MPRSYSFDHFTAVKPDPSKVVAENGTHHPVKSETPMPEQEGLHYGRQHAQTVARLQARRMDRETEHRLAEEAQRMDEQPPAELVEVAKAPRKRAKRAPATKRTASKTKEHHTSVARRSTSTRKAAGARKKTTARPARKTTRGTKQVPRSGAMARTARGAKRPTAKKTPARGTAKRTPKRR